MKKPIKYLWLALGGVVALVVAGILVFALTFDPNRYKGEIERMAMERTGRTLRLQGELELVFFPSLGAGVGGVTLSERGSRREFVSLQSARASVKLVPLLRGQVIVDAVRVSGLRAQLVRNKDGSYNFSDLLEGKAEKPGPKRKEQSAPVIFDIAGVDIDRAAVAYRDNSTGQEISLSDLKLRTGRIAESAQGRIELATTAKRNQPPLEAKIALHGSYSLQPDSIDLDFTARLDESSIRGKLGVARTAQPSYRFDLDIDRLNLDHYLAASEKKPEAAKQDSPAKDPAVDLSGLKGLNAQGQLQVGALQVQGLKLSRLKAQLKAAGGRAEISPHSASLYEGELSGALSLDGNANRVALKETLSNVSVGPLLRDAAQQDRLEGRGNLALDVTAAGASVNTMKRSLAGSAKVHLRDGAIKGINIAEILRKARAALGKRSGEAADSKDKTDFSELSASFTIKNGVAHNDDLDLKSPLLRIGGVGDIDIGRSTISYVVKASVVATSKGQGGKELDELAGLTVPVKLSGSFDALKYEVDYRAVAGDLAKSRVGDKVRDRLKGLIGR
jgi:AsmA protein